MEPTSSGPDQNDVLGPVAGTENLGAQTSPYPTLGSRHSAFSSSTLKGVPEIIIGPVTCKPSKAKGTVSRETDDEALSEKAIPTAKKKSRRNVDVFRVFKREIRATGVLLLDFYRRFQPIDVNCTPRQHFCKEQVLRWVLNIVSCIRNRRFTHHHGNEAFINLYNLFVAQANMDSNITQYFHELLVLFNAAFGELQSLSQSLRRAYIDYTALISRLRGMVQTVDHEQPPKLKHFRIIRLLGAGSFGACYKVQHTASGHVYALKIVSASSYPTLDHAIADRICGSVTNHPMVVRYFACYPVSDYHVSIMEYVPGMDLQVVTNAVSSFTIEQMSYIAAQLVAGLQHMHYRGLMHRDIKLSNVLITDRGKVKIIDFDTVKVGLALSAKQLNKSFLERTAGEHKDQEMAGTAPYMAPEVVSRRRYGRAADWWSLGVVLFRLLDGKLPFNGDTDDALRRAILNHPLKFRKWKEGGKAAAELRNFISALLTKDSVDRLGTSSCDELLMHKFFASFNWNNVERSEIFELTIVAELLSSSSEGADRKSAQNNFRPEILYDLPIDTKSMVLVFSSSIQPVRKVISPVLELTVDESSPCPTSTGLLSRLEAESISVLYNPEWNLGLVFSLVTAEDGSTFPIITGLHPDCPKVSMLIEGDIVARIDNHPVISVPVSEAQALVAVPGYHVLQILNSNPLRVFNRVLNRRALLRKYPAFDTVLTKPSKGHESLLGSVVRWLRRQPSHRFITVRELTSKSPKGKPIKYFLVSGVDDLVEANIFVGDLIVSVNGIETQALSLDWILAILECRSGPVYLKLLATSALRNDRCRFDRLFTTYSDNP